MLLQQPAYNAYQRAAAANVNLTVPVHTFREKVRLSNKFIKSRLDQNILYTIGLRSNQDLCNGSICYYLLPV